MKLLHHPIAFIIAGIVMAVAWVFYEHFWFLGLVAFWPYLSLLRQTEKPFASHLLAGFLFLTTWFGVAGFWLTSYNWNNYLFALFGYVLIYLAIIAAIYFVNRRLSPKHGLLSFFVFWLCIEFMQGWLPGLIPWFSLGNLNVSTGYFYDLFSFTGVRGASLWILLMNYFSFQLVIEKKVSGGIFAGLVAISPLLFPQPGTDHGTKADKKTLKLLIAQPNLLPDEKPEFNNLNDLPEVDLAVFPENFLRDTVDRESPRSSALPQLLKKTQASNIEHVITGTISKNREKYYNSAAFHNGPAVSFYNKTKLIPQVEWRLFGKGGYSKTPEQQTIFNLNGNAFFTAICIESVFGNYLRQVSRDSVDFGVVITNDKWFENTVAFNHHADHCKARAVELGIPIVRVANSGLSGIYYPDGGVELIEPGREQLKPMGLTLKNRAAFFSQYGDFTGRVALLLAPFLLLYAIVKREED